MDYIISLFRKAKPAKDFESKISKLISIQNMLKEQYKDLSKGTFYLLPDIIDMIQANINKFWEFGETLNGAFTVTDLRPVNSSINAPLTMETKSTLEVSTGKGKTPIGVAKDPYLSVPRQSTLDVPKISSVLSSAPVVSKKRKVADSFKFAADQDRAFREFAKQDAQSIIQGSWIQSEAWIKELEMYPGLNCLDETEEPDDGFDEWAEQGNFRVILIIFCTHTITKDEFEILFPTEVQNRDPAIELDDNSVDEEGSKTFSSLKEEMDALKAQFGLEFERLVQKNQTDNLWMIFSLSGMWRMVVRIDEVSREIRQLQWLQGQWDVSLPSTLTQVVETIHISASSHQ